MSTEFASANLTAGQINAIVKKLGGENDALRFLRGELIVAPPSSLAFTSLGKVRLNVWESSEALKNDLKDRFELTTWMVEVINLMPLVKKAVEIEPVLVTPLSLGFAGTSIPHGKFYARAKEFALDLVPAQLAFELYRQHTVMPMNETWWMGMEWIKGVRGVQNTIVGLRRREGDPYLELNSGCDEAHDQIQDTWMFARKQK